MSFVLEERARLAYTVGLPLFVLRRERRETGPCWLLLVVQKATIAFVLGKYRRGLLDQRRKELNEGRLHCVLNSAAPVLLCPVLISFAARYNREETTIYQILAIYIYI